MVVVLVVLLLCGWGCYDDPLHRFLELGIQAQGQARLLPRIAARPKPWMPLPSRSLLPMHPNVNELKCGCGLNLGPKQVVMSPMDQPQVPMLADHSRRFLSPAFNLRIGRRTDLPLVGAPCRIVAATQS